MVTVFTLIVVVCTSTVSRLCNTPSCTPHSFEEFTLTHMELKQLSFLILAAFALAIMIVAFSAADFSQIGSFGAEYAGSCVGVLHVSGEITSSSGPTVFSTHTFTPDDMREALAKADDDPDVASILIIIDSPGGSAVASKEAYDIVRDAKKPVVAYLGEVAASGGYYVASAADHIIANPNTLTGSIGARATLFSYEELFTKLGLREESLKTGEHKDIGAPYRNATEEERIILQSILNESFENFKADVVSSRGKKLNEQRFAQALDGRVLGAKAALSIGLVDEIGNRKKAMREAAALGNLTRNENELPQECTLDREPTLIDALSQLSTSFGQGLASPLSKPRVALNYDA